MSRLAKKPIDIPKGTTLTVDEGVITVKGPKGEISRPLHSDISVIPEGESVQVSIKKESALAKALVGTFASHIRNMFEGVVTPFKKILILEGVGYRVEQKGDNLQLLVGFSHPVLMPIPEGITTKVEKGTLTIEGIDKDVVGQFAAEIRAMKKPEPYKGKGFRYSDEVIRRKQGKKAV